MNKNIIKTHFDCLDPMLGGGFHYPSLTVVGARPGMGKTAFMLSIASNLIEKDISFGYISLSEDSDQIFRKIACNIAEISYEKCILPWNEENLHDLDGIQCQRLAYAVTKMKSSNSQCEFNCFTVDELFLCLERMVRDKISIIFIDYLQLLMRLGSGDIYQETSKIVNEFKIFCNINNISIVIASQLSREIEKRPGHRPILSDFRDTGAVEEAADQVLLLLRREYYDPNDKPGMAEIIIAKNRFGNLGICKMGFEKKNFKFFDS